jgi:hypothetical protein
MSLAARIGRLEAAFTGGDRPQRATIWFGDCFTQHTIERHEDALHLTVPCDPDDSVWDHLTPEQNAAIKGIASVTCFEGIEGFGREIEAEWGASCNIHAARLLGEIAN